MSPPPRLGKPSSTIGDPDALYLAGLRAGQAGRLTEADRCLSEAVALRPNSPAFHCALGHIRSATGRFAEGLSCHDAALALDATHLAALSGRAEALHELGRLTEAEAAYRQASRQSPHAPGIWFGWATVLADLGRLEEAAKAYRKVLALSPGLAEACVNLGTVLRDLGQLEEAAAQFERALVLKPHIDHATAELVSALSALNRGADALDHASRAMRHDPRSSAAQRAFCIAAARLDSLPESAEIAGFLEHCLSAEEGEHDELAKACAWQLRRRYRIDPAPADAARHTIEAAISGTAADFCSDPLVLRFLTMTVNTDPQLELFLTEARRRLSRADYLPATLNPFLAALALQCFNNGYVFAVTPDEEARVSALRLDLDHWLSQGTGSRLDIEQVLLRFALYEPMASLTRDKRRLDALIGPVSPVRRVVAHCLAEPLEEAALAREISSVGSIENRVSRAVREQYEEHPYPRWLSLPRTTRASLPTVLRRKFPSAPLPSFLDGPIEILVAGCGTGRQPIVTALSITNAHVLAVDLSRASLSYAKRMALRLGASNVSFLHADLLTLGELGREFPVVEAVGVLHHMEDPIAGWRVLKGLLRPGGFMRIGLYSALARTEVVAARERIARRGISATASEIRAFRQSVLFGDARESLPGLALSKDIYDLNGCRDLLFHTHEHCFTIPLLQGMLQALGLEFIGFELADERTIHAYRREYPNDPARSRLDCWARFEAAHPTVFSGMYVFWCRKAADALV